MQNLLALVIPNILWVIAIIVPFLIIFIFRKLFFANKLKIEVRKGKEPFTIGEIAQLARDNDLTIVGSRIHEGLVTDKNIPMNFAGKTDFHKEPFYRLLVEEDEISKYFFVQKDERDFCILKKDFPIFFCDQGNEPIEIPPEVSINSKEDNKDFDSLNTAHYP